LHGGTSRAPASPRPLGPHRRRARPGSTFSLISERLTDYYNELPLGANLREWARSQAEQVYRDWATVRRYAIRQEQGDDLSSSSGDSGSSGKSSDGGVEETPLVARARRIANVRGPRAQDATPFVEDDNVCEDVGESVDNGSVTAEGVVISDGGDVEMPDAGSVQSNNSLRSNID
jgi:hypothetical protein